MFVYASSLSREAKNLNTVKISQIFLLSRVYFLVIWERGFLRGIKMRELEAHSLYSSHSLGPLVLLASYLLVALLILVKLVRWSEGPLKSL